MADELHVHVIMNNGQVLDFTMHKDEVAQFMEELAQEGYDGEPIESVRIGGVMLKQRPFRASISFLLNPNRKCRFRAGFVISSTGCKRATFDWRRNLLDSYFFSRLH